MAITNLSCIDTLNDNVLVQMVDKRNMCNNTIDLVCISDPSCIQKNMFE